MIAQLNNSETDWVAHSLKYLLYYPYTGSWYTSDLDSQGLHILELSEKMKYIFEVNKGIQIEKI